TQEEPQGQNRSERRVLQRQQKEEGPGQAEPVLKKDSNRQMQSTAAGPQALLPFLFDPAGDCLCLQLSVVIFPLCYPETSMPHELPKVYDPAAIEEHWAEYWVRERLFHVT